MFVSVCSTIVSGNVGIRAETLPSRRPGKPIIAKKRKNTLIFSGYNQTKSVLEYYDGIYHA